MTTFSNILSIITPVITAILVLMIGILIDVMRDHTAAINDQRNRATQAITTQTHVLRRLDDVETKLYKHELKPTHKEK